MYTDRIIIEVTDLGIIPKHFVFKEQIEDQELLDEFGRGLFLVNQFSSNCYYNDNSVITEIEVQGGQDEAGLC